MRRRSLLWLLFGALFFLGVLCYWKFQNHPAIPKPVVTQSPAAASSARGSVSTAGAPSEVVKSSSTAPLIIEAHPPTTNSVAASSATNRAPWLKYRLSNTPRTAGQLSHSDAAVLLENALIDTSVPFNISIPQHLRSQGDPGAYIVQARGPVDAMFRSELAAAGATIVSYIPNNAYLVRASQGAAQQLGANPQTATVLPYEPYYKLSPSLLGPAVEQQPMAPFVPLTLVVFPDARESTMQALDQMGVSVVAEGRSPFGPVLTIHPNGSTLPELAGLPGVHLVEPSSDRTSANDLSRVIVGVATNTQTANNYLDLNGANVVINENDSGVDQTHGDLTGRVFSDLPAIFLPAALTDTNGHGTHVAGIMIGDGSLSTSVTAASGSIMPPVAGQFRGKAPSAQIYSLPINGPLFLSDFDLQQMAGRTNAMISNNSWNYASSDYDIFAATYDAGVRDTLPAQTGSQPIVVVFSAGNNGNGADDGTGVTPGSILSPATAKNTITVGATEMPRGITNEVDVSVFGTTNTTPTFPFTGITDSDNQVASFSSRGNVGINIEGDFGRFKPDVVAPGVFVVSTRSTQWDQNAYYNPTNLHFNTFQDVVPTNSVNGYPIFLPFNTVEWGVSVKAIYPLVDLPIYTNQTRLPITTDVPAGTNSVFFNNPSPVEAFWFYGIGNPTNRPVRYEVTSVYGTTNDNGNFFQVLSNLNNGLAPNYRYETGTSMSAADVSGVLALMEDFFTNKLQIAPSPALMKAMLINGARTVNAMYDLQVQKSLNDQGWGIVNITNTLPSTLAGAGASFYNPASGASGPMLVYDQNPTNALVTGDRRTINISVSSTNSQLPVRVTLVWTDPPGNPAASIKLVNDLDLVVTNTDTGDVFFGNDIPAGSSFNFPFDTNSAPNIDNINNVENVFLEPPLGTNYSITVIGHHVNVNAVTAHPDDVAQDYALVISGDSQAASAISITADTGKIAAVVPTVTAMTNEFTGSTNVTGELLLNQHVGANSPLLGQTQIPLGTNTVFGPGGAGGLITLGVENQWHFYTITNTEAFTNAVFATFLPVNLSPSRMGVTNVDNPEFATRVEPDIDLYVSTDPNLLALNPAAMQAAIKSVGRGGEEIIVLSNAVGGTYYIGVKSEDQQAAEYAFFGAFSLLPFSSSGPNGVDAVGINVPQNIPDGSPTKPGAAQILSVVVQPITVRRVLINDRIEHQRFGDLLGDISHNRITVDLNNHSCPALDGSGNCVTNFAFSYDDSGQNDIPNAMRTDGPNSLNAYVGEKGEGLWLFTQIDNAFGATGRVDSVSIHLDPEPQIGDTNGAVFDIGAHGTAIAAVDVPPEATNMTICVQNESATPLPLQLYVRAGAIPLPQFDYFMPITGLGGCLSISTSDLPPLQPGRYFIAIVNPNNISQTVRLTITFGLSINPVKTVDYTFTGPVPIPDDAVSFSSLFVTNHAGIARVEVGVSIQHPRISDLVLTLISPSGKRIVLMENRGDDTANAGDISTVTNFGPTTFPDNGAGPSTNQLMNVPVSGTLNVNYSFTVAPSTMDIYYDGAPIQPTIGPVLGSGSFSVGYGPGVSSNIFIVVNQGGNANSNALARVRASVTTVTGAYLLFTENTNVAQIPIKFAIPPFLSTNSAVQQTTLSDFESAGVGDYISPSTVDGWTVASNRVSVMNAPTVAQAGNQYLTLANGTILRSLPTVFGKNYGVSFYYRGPGIAHWWRGESSPVATDIIGGNNGIFVGPVTFTNAVVGQGFYFNGSDYIRVTSDPSLSFTNAFTLETWYRDDSLVPNFGIIAKREQADEPANYGINIIQNPPGLGVYYNDTNYNASNNNSDDAASGSPYEVSRFNPIPPGGVFHHLAGVYQQINPTNIQIQTYIDGQLVRTKLVAGNFANTLNNDDVLIGTSFPTLTEFMTGIVDELSIYGRAISGSEANAIFAAGSAGKFDTNAPIPNALAEAQVVVGNTTNTLFGDNTTWQLQTANFIASQTGTPFQITGVEPGMLLDSFTLSQVGGGLNYFPEESLDQLKDDDAYGQWTLEIRDDRVGATTPPPLLASWQLRFVFETNSPPIIALHDHVPVTNSIFGCGIAYYYVDVPTWAVSATNMLLFATNSPVDLIFNQTLPPTGASPPDTFLLSNFSGTNTGIGSPVLTSNSVPPLIPGARYYLGVRNQNCSTNINYAIEVDFGTGFIVLTNMIPYANTNSGATNASDIYVYTVTTNAARAQFEIDNPSGNMTLVVSSNLPPPDLTTFDYISANPSTNDELIVLITNATRVELVPGNWYLTAINVSGAPAVYSIMASEWPVTGRPFAITNVFVATNNLFIVWQSLELAHYYVQGKTVLSDTNWYTLTQTLTGQTNVGSQFPLPLPSPFHYFRVVEGLALFDVPYPPPSLNVTVRTNGNLLSWLGSVPAKYQAQWTATLGATNTWNAFTNIITSPASSGGNPGVFDFLDDGTQTGGIGATRFYRIQQILPP